MYGLTCLAMIAGLTRFVSEKAENLQEKELYFRLMSQVKMNKYGYRTQNFANFDLALSCLMNEKYF